MINRTALVLTCQPSAVRVSEFHDSFCPPVGGQYFKASPVEAVLLNSDIAAVFDPPSASDLSAAFAVSFTITVGLWLAAKGFGVVLEFIRVQR